MVLSAITSTIAFSLLVTEPAKAVLTYSVYKDGPNDVLEALGSLQLPRDVGSASCDSSTTPPRGILESCSS